MKPLSTLSLIIILFASCKKNDDYIKDRIITGTVTVTGKAPQTFTATGILATFEVIVDYITKDTFYVARAHLDIANVSDRIGRIDIVIQDIHAAGNYEMTPDNASKSIHSYVAYTEGPNEYLPDFRVTSELTDSTGTPYSSVTFVIAKMTHEEMEGTINANIADADGIKVVLQNVQFKGRFYI